MNKFLLALTLLAPSTVLADGASDFAAMCSACHGATGAGDGAASAALPVRPADFTDVAFWATLFPGDFTNNEAKPQFL